MASMTRAVLCNNALRHIGVVDASETPSAEDQTLAENRFDSVLSELALDGTDDGITAGAVPEWAQVPMIELVAYEIAPSFGLAQNYAQRAVALARIRRQQSESSMPDLNLPIYRPTYL